MTSEISQTGSQSAAQSFAAAGAKDIDQTKTQFLQLLLAQLQNQDPLSPADTDQMSAQMMSLGQLEQLFDLNKNIQGLVSMQSSTQLAAYSSMVGKSALAKGSTIQISGENKGNIGFALAQVPKSTLIRVFDQNGNVVKEMTPVIEYPGMNTIAFDGLDAKGQPLPDGYYGFTVEALDDSGKAVPAVPYAEGKISSIRLESGVPIFQMGNQDVGLADIERIY